MHHSLSGGHVLARAKHLMEVFDARCRPVPGDPRTTSGVWRFHELIMPSLPVGDIVSLGEGIVPIWPAGKNLREWIGGDLDLWLIGEGQGPTGAFKDFGGTVATSVAKKSGEDSDICASTGDTSAMAAAYAAAAGMKCVVVLPRDFITAAQLAQLDAYGATVILVPGSFDDAMTIVAEMVEQKVSFPMNSLFPARIEGHQATVFLATQFFGWQMPDWFVAPVGNGSNTSSIGKGMRLLKDLRFVDKTAQILGVQSEAACPLERSWGRLMVKDQTAKPEDRIKAWTSQYESMIGKHDLGETTATAARINEPVSYKKVIREIVWSGGMITVAEEEDLNEAVMIAGSDGIFLCPQSGTALAGLRKEVRVGNVKPGSRVAVVCTATGLKFTEVPVQYKHLGLGKTIEAADCNPETTAEIIQGL
jgi:threonine synthase